jgi:GNAT superfamily N-acetyltransferase
MRLLDRLPALLRYARLEGWGALLRYCLGALPRMIYRKDAAYILVRDLDPPPEPGPPRAEVAIERLEEAQAGELERVVYYGRHEILRRFREGQICFVARIDGRIVHYSWMSRGREYAGEVEKELVFEPDERYLYNCRTLPAARGKGIYPTVIARAMREAHAAGARRMAALVSADNVASLRSFEKMRFRVREEIRLRRILWHRRHQTIRRDAHE